MGGGGGGGTPHAHTSRVDASDAGSTGRAAVAQLQAPLRRRASAPSPRSAHPPHPRHCTAQLTVQTPRKKCGRDLAHRPCDKCSTVTQVSWASGSAASPWAPTTMLASTWAPALPAPPSVEVVVVPPGWYSEAVGMKTAAQPASASFSRSSACRSGHSKRGG